MRSDKLAVFPVIAAILGSGCTTNTDEHITTAEMSTASLSVTEAITEQTSGTTSSVQPEGDKKEAELKKITLTFLGDCILSSNEGDMRPDTFKKAAESKPSSYFFEKAVPYYENSDLVIANNEFVLSDDTELVKTEKDGTAFWFSSPTSFTDILKEARIDVVTIANNHTSDFGKKGYEDTKSALDDAGILWGDIENTVYCESNGITFAIICAKLFNENFDWLIDNALEEATQLSDVQIVYFHGGTEKEHIPEEWLQECCHNYVDQGADLVIGSHPHVLRPTEKYNGVDIFYSLGNFCYGANRLPENRTIILNEAFYFDESGALTYTEDEIIPFYVHGGITNNWQPCPVTDPVEISRTIAFMHGGSLLPCLENQH